MARCGVGASAVQDFKTLKYRPDFPARFVSIEDARAHCQVFFRWYNTVHRHSGIGLASQSY